MEVTADEAGQRVDNFLLSRAAGVPRSHVYRQIRTGQVRVNGGRIKPTRKLVLGDLVRIPPTKIKDAKSVRVPDALIRSLEKRVLHENDDFLVLNKPAGLAVHAGSGLDFGAIDALRQQFDDKSLELVHRLDRGTSGALLIARGRGKCRALQALFREHKVSKEYLALLDGVWDANSPKSVNAPLLKNKAHAGERRVLVSPDGQQALSHFYCQEKLTNTSLVRVVLETGRTHQIRVHANYIGHAVVGDTRYGDNAKNVEYKRLGLRRMYLHSTLLAFDWREQPFKIEAPTDEDWDKACSICR